MLKVGDLVRIPTQKSTGNNFGTFLQELINDGYTLPYLVVRGIHLEADRVRLNYHSSHTGTSLASSRFKICDVQLYFEEDSTPPEEVLATIFQLLHGTTNLPVRRENA